jgi:hypothetical protein
VVEITATKDALMRTGLGGKSEDHQGGDGGHRPHRDALADIKEGI